MGQRVVGAAVVLALILTGCANTPTTAGGAEGGGASARPSAPATAGAQDVSTSGRLVRPRKVDCGGSVYELAALADAPPATSLPDGPAEAVDDAGAPAFDPSQGWRVVQRSNKRVDLIRQFEKAETGGVEVLTHESLTLVRLTGEPDMPDGTWMRVSGTPCSQRLVTRRDLEVADIALAGAAAPKDTSVALLVYERACASGQPAHGRIELLDLVETDAEVRLRIGVRRLNEATCPSNPPTPFTVKLRKPLGRRQIVDASVVPARRVTVERR